MPISLWQPRAHGRRHRPERVISAGAIVPSRSRRGDGCRHDRHLSTRFQQQRRGRHPPDGPRSHGGLQPVVARFCQGRQGRLGKESESMNRRLQLSGLSLVFLAGPSEGRQNWTFWYMASQSENLLGLPRIDCSAPHWDTHALFHDVVTARAHPSRLLLPCLPTPTTTTRALHLRTCLLRVPAFSLSSSSP